jgi:hypothetical protein
MLLFGSQLKIKQNDDFIANLLYQILFFVYLPIFFYFFKTFSKEFVSRLFVFQNKKIIINAFHSISFNATKTILLAMFDEPT